MSKPRPKPQTRRDNDTTPHAAIPDAAKQEYESLMEIVGKAKERIKECLSRSGREAREDGEAAARMLLNLTRALRYYHSPEDSGGQDKPSNDPLDTNI